MRIADTILKDWLDAMQKAACELTQTRFGFEQRQTIYQESRISENQIKGALVPLISNEESIQIGIISSLAGCEKLGRAFLGLTPEENITEEDIDAAIREIVNILAVQTKAMMHKGTNVSKMGLPIIIKGHSQITQTENCVCQPVQWGEIDCLLVVFTTSKPPSFTGTSF